MYTLLWEKYFCNDNCVWLEFHLESEAKMKETNWIIETFRFVVCERKEKIRYKIWLSIIKKSCLQGGKCICVKTDKQGKRIGY